MNGVNKNSILIVDDDRMVIMALTQILSPEYTILAVKDGQDAILKAERFLPDVILLDVIMPDMDGYDVIAALKSSERTKSIPVIFITALDRTGDEEKGLLLGAADYITKPFNSAIVKLRVQNQVKIINQTRLIIEKEVVEKSNRARIEFLLNVSHEMLTPMNAIMGMTQIAQKIKNPEKTEDCLDEIDTASRYLLGMIKDLLEVSGNNVDALTLVNSVFSFKAMFRNILERINSEVEKKQQSFTHYIDPSIPMLLLGDEKHLSQVIVNLLSNAVRFTPELGKIDFSTFVKSKENETITLQVEVTDNWIDTPQENKNDVFNLFKQIDNSTFGRHDSIRLGSSRTKRIIEMMNGEIWGDFEAEKGSKITFTCKLGIR